jgi:hypothetical protein
MEKQNLRLAMARNKVRKGKLPEISLYSLGAQYREPSEKESE